jgi:F-type H+-transporting ATPase subunit a
MYSSHGLLHVMIMFFVLVLITIFSLAVGAKYRKMLADPTPQAGVSGANLMEMIVQTVLGLMHQIIGHGSEKYLPLIGTLAFVILFNNLLGLIPGFYTATDNLNTTLAFAAAAIVLYHCYGIKTHGLGKYLAHFMGPVEGKVKYIMAPLMVPIELISHVARLFSLSLRLFGNMFGDHKVFAVFMGLVALPLLYPLPFLALGLLVAIVQTLVFCLLTMVYIGLATAEEH